MTTQSTTALVRWENLIVRSESDIVLDIAQQMGWEDCEVFGYGEMIAQPIESKGWKLVPADLYEYSIPVEGVNRVYQIINSGVRIQGVIIADDVTRTVNLPKLAMPNIPLPSAGSMLTFIGKGLLWVITAVFIIPLAPLFLLSYIFDPKLVILVDDGNGNTVWISLLTWYE